jgi:hypothetical protein
MAVKPASISLLTRDAVVASPCHKTTGQLIAILGDVHGTCCDRRRSTSGGICSRRALDAETGWP